MFKIRLHENLHSFLHIEGSWWEMPGFTGALAATWGIPDSDITGSIPNGQILASVPELLRHAYLF